MNRENILKALKEIPFEEKDFMYEEYKIENRVLKVLGLSAQLRLNEVQNDLVQDDPISEVMAWAVTFGMAWHLCGPAANANYTIDPRPSCQISNASLSQCSFACGPYISLINANLRRVRIYPPCHGQNNSTCTNIQGPICANCGCVMLKGRGCYYLDSNQIGTVETIYSVLDTSETMITFRGVEVAVLRSGSNILASAAYAMLTSDVTKTRDDVLYTYIRIQAPAQYHPTNTITN
ncbi:MAG: hypothetical protein QW607_11430 [Desulfurococcaceae archaeon]